MDRDLDSVKRNGLSVGIRISLHFFVAYVVLKLEFKLKHSVLNTIFGFCCPIGKAQGTHIAHNKYIRAKRFQLRTSSWSKILATYLRDQILITEYACRSAARN